MNNQVIAVIFGGVSNENEISVITGVMACNVLASGGERVLPVYISQQGEFFAGEELKDINVFKNGGYKNCPRAVIADGGAYIKNRRGKFKKFVKISAALNCCHGGAGEGGGVSGLCALADIPFAGAGMFESAAFLDKYYSKLILSSLGVKTAEYAYVTGESEGLVCAKKLGYPVIVKPARLGSSIGVSEAADERELAFALKVAFEYDGGVLIEKYLTDKREINCAAYFADGRCVVSECEECFSRGDILSYDDKYAGGGCSRFPAEIPPELSEKIRALTAEVYNRLYMRGIVRFDYILSGGELYLSEINTVPGSLAHYLLSEGYKNFYPVLQAIIAQAKADYAENKQKTLLYTGILNNFSSNACKLK